MKKTFIIALCCLAVAFASCKKKPVDPTPVDPTPVVPVDYASNYVGKYLGGFNFIITSMNNQSQGMSFLIDNIGMDITQNADTNTVSATVTVDNETRQTRGTTTEEKADFESVHLIIDKPDQHYWFELDLKMEGTKTGSDTLNITGAFSGNGKFTVEGYDPVQLDEVSGKLNGSLVKQ